MAALTHIPGALFPRLEGIMSAELCLPARNNVRNLNVSTEKYVRQAQFQSKRCWHYSQGVPS